ncbi:MAG: PQQ-binding-like beta-propeller repeat protein, partial [Planctomycetota bacterium]
MPERVTLFRAIITGLVVVALWLAQGDAQDPLKQPGQPGPGQPGPADPDELATLVYPNHQARDRLDSALAALERGDLKNAVTNLGELFEHQADPSDPRRGALLVKDDGRVYRDARAIARRAVAERADGEKFVAEFRKQFDGVARRQLVAAMATMDLGALAELAARYPLCSCYDDVLRALADIAFDRGNFPMAARVRGVVLQREIEAGTVVPPEQRATDLARWALCAYIAQDDETTTRVLRRLRNDYAAVAFRLGPRDWTGATFDPADREAFRTDGLRESRRFSARVTAVTPMLADETAGLPDDYGQPLWSNRLPQPKVDAGGGVAPVDGVDPLPQRHRPAIAVGRVVVLPDPDRVIALDVITGAQAWDRNRYIGTKPLLEHSDMSDLFDETGKLGLARYDEGYDEVLVEGGRVLMQMQYPWVVRTEGGPGGRPTERLGRTTVLAALDSANGGIRWIQGRFRNGDTRSDGIRSVRRVPTAHNGRLYLPVSSGGGLYLACLDPLDGRVHWMTYLHFDPVGAAENNGPVGQPWIDPRQPRPAGASWSNRVLPVTFDGDMAYIVSTAGGVSAVDIVTGEVEWVSEYAPEYAQQLSGGQAGSRESWNCPPVVIDGRLVFAVRSPTGQSILRILDTRTGRVVASATGLTDVLGVVRIGPEVRIITRIGDDDVAAFSLLARRVWEARIPGGSGSGTIVDGSLLLWPCGNRLALIDIGDGSQLPAPQIRPDPTIPLGDLSMTGGLLVARHSEGVQAFLDVKRSEPFVKATMESDPSGPAGYLLQSTRLQLLGDMNGAVAAILDAQAHVRSAAAGQAVLERWVRLLDDRARAKIVVPDDELELLQAFAKKYANELMALTLPVRVFLQAKQYEQAAASCMQLLTARSGSPVRLDDRREVRSAALVATYIPDWRQQGGEEFAAALASALDARLQTMAAADADGIQRTRLLALTDDWPGAVARRLQLADAAVTAGSWTAAFVQGLAVFRHARAGDDEGKRGAMIVLRAADELHRADELVQAAQYLRAHSGDDPAVAELLAGHAAGLVDAWTSSAVELASARAF